jgi:feruloyl esterase
MIATYGNADQVIPPNGIYHYYNRLMRQYQGAKRTQEFYRLFIFPDASHCRGAGMDRDDLFLKLVDWVENGVEPDYYVAQVNEDRTRKVCMYPNTMVYDGSGDINDEASFYCQVNKKDDPHLIVEGKVTPLEKPDPVTTLGETSKHSKH